MNIRACLLLVLCSVTFSFSLHAMWGGDGCDEWPGALRDRGYDFGSLFSSDGTCTRAREDSDSGNDLHTLFDELLELGKSGLQPFTAGEAREMRVWEGPKGSSTKESWTLEELLQNPQTQRLKISSQDVKDFMLQKASHLGTPGSRYIAACCIAAGANPEKHRTRTSWLSEAIGNNDVGFVQSIVHAKPNPNRRHKLAHGSEDIVLEEPLFFDARNVEMAQVLLSVGADYKEKGGLDNGTILHHLCTLTFGDGEPEVELLQFYLAHKADPNEVDACGRTPLHVLGERMRYTQTRYSIPYALMLLRHGAKPAIKHEGRTFLECIDQDKYQPKQGHFSSRLLYAYIEQYLRPDTKRAIMPTICGEQSLQCACLNTRKEELKEFTQETLAALKAAIPLVPDPCVSLDCTELRKHPTHAWWLLLDKHKSVSKEIDEEAIKLMVQETEPCFMDWQKGRTLAALLIAINPHSFIAALKEKKFDLGNIALLQDDVAFMEYMLRHNVHLIRYIGWARSVRMASLLKKYYPHCFTEKDSTGGNVFHNVATFGALMDEDLPRWYYEQDVNPLCVNDNGQTPLDFLAFSSYRFMRHEKKLIEIARILLLAGNDQLKKNEKTGKTPLDRAQESHALWNVPATGMLLTLLRVVSQEQDLLKKVHVIETVSRQLLTDLNPRKLTRTTGQKLQKIVTEKK